MDDRLLDMMVCPICKGKIIFDQAAQELICRADRLAFGIQDGIPVMLSERARKLSEAEINLLSNGA
jgi:uncharacterized protein